MASKGDGGPPPQTPHDSAWMITGYLAAGLVFYGGLGWLLGRWLGHQQLFIAAGLLFGIACSLYLVFARLRWEEKNGTHDLKNLKNLKSLKQK